MPVRRSISLFPLLPANHSNHCRMIANNILYSSQCKCQAHWEDKMVVFSTFTYIYIIYIYIYIPDIIAPVIYPQDYSHCTYILPYDGCLKCQRENNWLISNSSWFRIHIFQFHPTNHPTDRTKKIKQLTNLRTNTVSLINLNFQPSFLRMKRQIWPPFSTDIHHDSERVVSSLLMTHDTCGTSWTSEE